MIKKNALKIENFWIFNHLKAINFSRRDKFILAFNHNRKKKYIVIFIIIFINQTGLNIKY